MDGWLKHKKTQIKSWKKPKALVVRRGLSSLHTQLVINNVSVEIVSIFVNNI